MLYIILKLLTKCTVEEPGRPGEQVILAPDPAREYICLWGLQMKTNDSGYNWHVTLEARSPRPWPCEPTDRYFKWESRRPFSISRFIFIRFSQTPASGVKFGTLEKLLIMAVSFLHSHGPALRSSIWWKDEEVIILWYFDLWWMGPEIEKWLLL